MKKKTESAAFVQSERKQERKERQEHVFIKLASSYA
jgi:hypothetical protein